MLLVLLFSTTKAIALLLFLLLTSGQLDPVYALNKVKANSNQYSNVVGFVYALQKGAKSEFSHRKHNAKDQLKNIPLWYRPRDVKSFKKKRFGRIRTAFGINDEEFFSTFTFDPNDYYTLKTSEKSGSQFFITKNGQYMIKSVHKREAERLQSIIKPFEEYMVQNAHDTLIVPYLAVVKVRRTLLSLADYYVVMKSSIAPPLTVRFWDIAVDELFDLKGSSFDRYRDPKSVQNCNKALLDENWKPQGQKIEVGVEKTGVLKRILDRDSDFLSGLNLWDYSLLIATKKSIQEYPHKQGTIAEGGDKNLWRQFYGGTPHKNGHDVYYLGIIDYLMEYDIFAKMISHMAGVIVDRKRIDLIHPRDYRDRWMTFMNEHVLELQ